MTRPLSDSQRLRFRVILLITWGPYCSRLHGDGCGQYLPLTQLTVDHIKPMCDGGKRLDTSNMQLLCKICHHDKTRMENMKRANGGKIKLKLRMI